MRSGQPPRCPSLPSRARARLCRFKGLSHEELLVFQLIQNTRNKGEPLRRAADAASELR